MNDSADTLRFALVGCGRVASKHIHALHETPTARISAVCDIETRRAQGRGNELGVPAYSSIDEMLNAAHQDIDVVSILTPSGLHAEHCIRVAAAGKHVLVEKPMALRLRDADDMIAACRAAKVQLFVVKQVRQNPPIRMLKSALDERRFGKLVLGTVRIRWTRTQEYYDQDPWRGTLAMDGGVLANQGSHYVDLLQWLMGDVESVSAMTATRLARIEAEDTAVAAFRFSNGALGLIEATTATRPQDLGASLSILGEFGSVTIGGFSCNDLDVWSFMRPAPDSTPSPAITETTMLTGHRGIIQNVVDCIFNGQQPLVDGLEGRKSVELINAIYDAAARREELNLSSWRATHYDRQAVPKLVSH